jgi:hypothetical protein
MKNGKLKRWFIRGLIPSRFQAGWDIGHPLVPSPFLPILSWTLECIDSISGFLQIPIFFHGDWRILYRMINIKSLLPLAYVTSLFSQNTHQIRHLQQP